MYLNEDFIQSVYLDYKFNLLALKEWLAFSLSTQYHTWIQHYSTSLRINNGNWIEWSAIWAEIIYIISKLHECAERGQFEITSMISDQNCMTQGSITTL